MAVKNNIANEIRKEWIEKIKQYLEEADEDVAYIASNVINFPTVTANGDEACVEIKVSVPKEKEDDELYLKREAYKLTQENKRIEAERNAKKKADKIKADQEKREQKKREKEKLKEENERLKEGN